MLFFNLHTHKFTNNPAIFELVNQYPWEFDETIPFYSIGIHPWYIDELRLEKDLQFVDQFLDRFGIFPYKEFCILMDIPINSYTVGGA